MREKETQNVFLIYGQSYDISKAVLKNPLLLLASSLSNTE